MSPLTVAHQAPQFIGFSRQEYWNGLPFPSPILYIVVCICQFQSPNLSLPHLYSSNHRLAFYTCNSISGLPWLLSGEESACSVGDAGDAGSISGSEDPLEEVMATYSSILAWGIPRTEEPEGLQSIWSQRVRHD